jgi:hypothetical protein
MHFAFDALVAVDVAKVASIRGDLAGRRNPEQARPPSPWMTDDQAQSHAVSKCDWLTSTHALPHHW